MFDRGNAFRIVAVPIARVIASLLSNHTEYRLWVSAHRTLCLTYRDPAGHLIAVTEDWSGTYDNAVRFYHACDVTPNHIARRHIERYSEKD